MKKLRNNSINENAVAKGRNVFSLGQIKSISPNKIGRKTIVDNNIELPH